jgi:hypothetical protein
MEKENIIDVQSVTSHRATDKPITTPTTTYDIGNRKCIVERCYKSGSMDIENILMKLIKSNHTKH